MTRRRLYLVFQLIGLGLSLLALLSLAIAYAVGSTEAAERFETALLFGLLTYWGARWGAGRG